MLPEPLLNEIYTNLLRYTKYYTRADYKVVVELMVFIFSGLLRSIKIMSWSRIAHPISSMGYFKSGNETSCL